MTIRVTACAWQREQRRREKIQRLGTGRLRGIDRGGDLLGAADVDDRKLDAA